MRRLLDKFTYIIYLSLLILIEDNWLLLRYISFKFTRLERSIFYNMLFLADSLDNKGFVPKSIDVNRLLFK